MYLFLLCALCGENGLLRLADFQQDFSQFMGMSDKRVVAGVDVMDWPTGGFHPLSHGVKPCLAATYETARDCLRFGPSQAHGLVHGCRGLGRHFGTDPCQV